MTFWYEDTDNVVVGTAVPMASGDILYVKAGVAVGSKGAFDGISAAGSATADIYGAVLSAAADGFDSSAGSNSITIGMGGSVSAGIIGIAITGNVNSITNGGTITGSTGIYLQTGDDNTLINTGQISSGNGYAVYMERNGDSITNSGTISATSANAIAFAGSINDTVNTIDNSGTIVSGGSFFAIVTSNASTTIDNSGHIGGGIIFGAGTNVYDGTLGSVSGPVVGGSGSNTFTGGAGSDVFEDDSGICVFDGMGGNDSLEALGSQATIDGGDGNDTITMLGAFNAGDQINGGAGRDTLILNGNYSTGVVLGADTLTNVEKIVLDAGNSYKLTMDDGNVAAGARLIADASALGSSNTLNFNGAAETDGHFLIVGGAGNDTLVGGAGNDTISGGGGNNHFTGGGGADRITAVSGEHDHFIYTDVSDSTSTVHDILTGFDGSLDKIDLDVAVTGINAEVTSGKLSASNFDANLATAITSGHLAAGHAVLFTPTTGGLAGHTFLIVDANGVAGYQAGQDYVFDLVSPVNLSHLTTSTFI